MSYYDDELTKALHKLKISYEKLEIREHDKLVSTINAVFPFSGSKISWEEMSDTTHFDTTSKQEAFSFITTKAIDTTKNVFLIGDSATNTIYKIKSLDLSLALKELDEIPQHSYVTPQNLDWIFCISMEGDIDFGLLPRL
ncbi:hypothetical protein [Pseudomonas batumici]|uniref:hypothetical protein n=1 Tax=Pseudomonas batumici TaxID=226910 RepID=UPI000589E87A|nr:hypothetical protein [Pseudomonas batumici]